MQTLYLKSYLKISHWFRSNYYYDTNKRHQRHQNCPSAFDRAALYRVFARITTPHMYEAACEYLVNDSKRQRLLLWRKQESSTLEHSRLKAVWTVRSNGYT